MNPIPLSKKKRTNSLQNRGRLEQSFKRFSFLFIFAFMFTCFANAKDRCILSIQMDKSQYTEKDAILLTLLLKNQTKDTIVLPDLLSIGAGTLSFEIKNEKGKSITYKGPHFKIIPPGNFKLGIDEIWGCVKNLTEFYKFEKGKYSVKCIYNNKYFAENNNVLRLESNVISFVVE